MNKQRIYAFDIIRTLAAYAVIIVHVTAIAYTLYNRESYQLLAVTLLNRVFKFTTPVFIFLGGLMVNVKYTRRPFKSIPFYIDRFRRIYVPYLIFSILYMISHVILYKSTYTASVITEQLIYGSAKYHLYFVTIITQLYLLTPMLLKLRKSNHKLLFTVIILAVNLWAVISLSFPYSDRIFIKYLFPFVVGLLYGPELPRLLKPVRIKAIVVISTLATGAMYAITFYLQTIGLKYYSPNFQILIWFVYTNLCIFGLLILAGWLEKTTWLKDRATNVTQFSFFIYLIHPLVLDVNEKLLNTIDIQSVSMRFLSNLVVTLTVSTILSISLKKLFTRLGLA